MLIRSTRLLSSVALMLSTALFGTASIATDHHHHQSAEKMDRSADTMNQPPTAVSPALSAVKNNYTLIDAAGNTIEPAQFHGKYLAITFGFTHCKHICPTIMSDWARAVKQLSAEQQAQLQVVLVTVDPDRDTPEVTDQYAKLFNQSFIGLSGSSEQIAEATANFRITTTKIGDGDDYQINHTALSYLISPAGEVLDFVGFGVGADKMAETVAKAIK